MLVGGDEIETGEQTEDITNIDPIFNIRCSVYLLIESHFQNNEDSLETEECLEKIVELETTLDSIL